MTERKPRHVSFDTWIEAQIREAQDRGEFENLPGKGKPLAAIDGPPDAMWWVKQLMVRERLSYLPPALAVRREAEKLLEELADVPSEAKLRQAVGELNDRIREMNRKPEIDGPPTSLMPLNIDAVVERWRVAREQRESQATVDQLTVEAAGVGHVATGAAAHARQPRHWRQRFRRSSNA